MNRFLAVAVLLTTSLALAEVGKITKLDGAATRTPDGKAAEALTEGATIDLKDTITVTAGNLKFELTDGSVIALDKGSVFTVNEAEFKGQERSAFSGFLKSGSLWTKVKKAMGGGKFEVTTERAVAGVRGTIFRIDADTLVKAAKGGGGAGVKASIVRVVEGVVAVHPGKTIAKTIKAALPKKGTRSEIAGPTEVSADDWEARFVDLQKNTQIAVGVDLWEQAQYDEAAKNDAFAKWLEKNP